MHDGDGGRHKTSLLWLWALAGAFAGLLGAYLWAVHNVPTCTVRSLGDPATCGASLLLLPPVTGVGALIGGAIGAMLGRPARR